MATVPRQAGESIEQYMVRTQPQEYSKGATTVQVRHGETVAQANARLSGASEHEVARLSPSYQGADKGVLPSADKPQFATTPSGATIPVSAGVAAKLKQGQIQEQAQALRLAQDKSFEKRTITEREYATKYPRQYEEERRGFGVSASDIRISKTKEEAAEASAEAKQSFQYPQPRERYEFVEREPDFFRNDLKNIGDKSSPIINKKPSPLPTSSISSISNYMSHKLFKFKLWAGKWEQRIEERQKELPPTFSGYLQYGISDVPRMGLSFITRTQYMPEAIKTTVKEPKTIAEPWKEAYFGLKDAPSWGARAGMIAGMVVGGKIIHSVIPKSPFKFGSIKVEAPVKGGDLAYASPDILAPKGYEVKPTMQTVKAEGAVIGKPAPAYQRFIDTLVKRDAAMAKEAKKGGMGAFTSYKTLAEPKPVVFGGSSARIMEGVPAEYGGGFSPIQEVSGTIKYGVEMPKLIKDIQKSMDKENKIINGKYSYLSKNKANAEYVDYATGEKIPVNIPNDIGAFHYMAQQFGAIPKTTPLWRGVYAQFGSAGNAEAKHKPKELAAFSLSSSLSPFDQPITSAAGTAMWNPNLDLKKHFEKNAKGAALIQKKGEDFYSWWQTGLDTTFTPRYENMSYAVKAPLWVGRGFGEAIGAVPLFLTNPIGTGAKAIQGLALTAYAVPELAVAGGLKFIRYGAPKGSKGYLPMSSYVQTDVSSQFLKSPAKFGSEFLGGAMFFGGAKTTLFPKSRYDVTMLKGKTETAYSILTDKGYKAITDQKLDSYTVGASTRPKLADKLLFETELDKYTRVGSDKGNAYAYEYTAGMLEKTPNPLFSPPKGASYLDRLKAKLDNAYSKTFKAEVNAALDKGNIISGGKGAYNVVLKDVAGEPLTYMVKKPAQIDSLKFIDRAERFLSGNKLIRSGKTHTTVSETAFPELSLSYYLGSKPLTALSHYGGIPPSIINAKYYGQFAKSSGLKFTPEYLKFKGAKVTSLAVRRSKAISVRTRTFTAGEPIPAKYLKGAVLDTKHIFNTISARPKPSAFIQYINSLKNKFTPKKYAYEILAPEKSLAKGAGISKALRKAISKDKFATRENLEKFMEQQSKREGNAHAKYGRQFAPLQTKVKVLQEYDYAPVPIGAEFKTPFEMTFGSVKVSPVQASALKQATQQRQAVQEKQAVRQMQAVRQAFALKGAYAQKTALKQAMKQDYKIAQKFGVLQRVGIKQAVASKQAVALKQAVAVKQAVALKQALKMKVAVAQKFAVRTHVPIRVLSQRYGGASRSISRYIARQYAPRVRKSKTYLIPLADMASLGVSEARYGKATHPAPTKKVLKDFEQYLKKGWGYFGTKEQRKRR